MKRFLTVSGLLLLAIGVLGISLLRSARIDRAFSGDISLVSSEENPSVDIPYNFPYPGILPDSPLWPIKALRDRVWVALTTNKDKKAEVLLFLADKRIAAAKMLFEKGKAEIGFATLTKAEKYLEAASKQVGDCWKDGSDSKGISYRLTLAALKHREFGNYFVTIAPEDARPGIISGFKYSSDVYTRCRESLISRGMSAPENPFDK
jgi:hypothetical protein